VLRAGVCWAKPELLPGGLGFMGRRVAWVRRCAVWRKQPAVPHSWRRRGGGWGGGGQKGSAEGANGGILTPLPGCYFVQSDVHVSTTFFVLSTLDSSLLPQTSERSPTMKRDLPSGGASQRRARRPVPPPTDPNVTHSRQCHYLPQGIRRFNCCASQVRRIQMPC
jgi:hypothetical protein